LCVIMGVLEQMSSKNHVQLLNQHLDIWKSGFYRIRA
jgi:hypothetical protein